MEPTSLRELSKKNFTTVVGNSVDNDTLKTGAMLRIADSVEKMAQYHVNILRDLENYKSMVSSKNETIQRLYKTNSALRGVITKLKKSK